MVTRLKSLLSHLRGLIGKGYFPVDHELALLPVDFMGAILANLVMALGELVSLPWVP
jgi:hypothetical protein